jgi:hypothetical protein
MNSMKKRKHPAAPALKKKLKDFLMKEEGKITKKDIVKMGTSLLIAGLMLPGQADAQHSSGFIATGTGGHASHTSHSSHGSHGSHAATWS